MTAKNTGEADRECRSPHVVLVSLAAAAVLSAVFTCAGCGGSVDARGKRVAVHGDVKLDGNPLESAAIVFHCGEGENEVTAFAFVEDGAYEIAAKEGPLVGKARVEFQPKPVDQQQYEDALEVAARTRRPVKVTEVVIPPQYVGQNTILSADVTEDGDNKFDFQLTSRR